MDYTKQYGVRLELVDLEEVMAKLKNPPIIVNNIDMTSPTALEKLKSLMFSYYGDTSLDIVPSCKGNHLRGDSQVGKICPICNTEVTKSTEEVPESALWLQIPKGLSPVLSPMAWMVLGRVINSRMFKCDLLHWLITPTYRPPKESVELTRTLDRIKMAIPGLTRGINYFYANFDTIWNTLINIHTTSGPTKNRHKWIEADIFVKKYRKVLFTRYIPFPSRLLFVIESTAYSSYADKRIFLALDALNTVAGIDIAYEGNPRKQETRIARCLSLLGTESFYGGFIQGVLGMKKGMLRGHVYAGKGHFTARAVIASITGPHVYDECEIPWGVAVELLSVHIWNKLINDYGFSALEAERYTRDHAQRYSAVISDIFDEFLRTTRHKGIPVVLQRNPSLARLSMQQLFVMSINRDPYSAVFKISALILDQPNADFDGDLLNLKLILDETEYAVLSKVHPSMGALSIDKPRTVSSAPIMQPEIIAMAINYLEEGYKLCGERPDASNRV